MPASSRADDARWPPAHWEQLARSLREAGIPTVAVGAAGERALVPAAADACGIGLGPTAALLRRAAAVVANDSGLMHLATAVGTPVIALFGPSGEVNWGPWGDGHVVLKKDWECRPCGQDGCQGSKRSRCLEEISEEEVLQEVFQLLGRNKKN